MRQLVTEEFSPLNETTGTIQNASRINTVEISTSTVKNSGVILQPLTKISFHDQTLYARCANGAGAEIIVLPFTVGVSGNTGGSDISSSNVASDEQITDILDHIFGKDEKCSICGCSAIEFVSDKTVDNMLAGIFGGGGSSATGNLPTVDIASDEQINTMLSNIFRLP